MNATPTKNRIARKTVLRQDEHGGWYVMDSQEAGWARGYGPFLTLDAVLKVWDVTLGDEGSDTFGPFQVVLPA